MNDRAWLLGGLAYLLMLGALIFIRSELAALALPALVYLTTAVFFSPGKPRLRVERKLSAERISQGKPALVSLVVHNEGEDLEEIYLEDILEKESEKVASKICSLPSKSRQEWAYILQRDRGDYHIAGLRAFASDYFGLFTSQLYVPSSAQILIYPQTERLRRIPLHPPVTRGFAGYIPARRGGSGTDFFSVREYQSGDSQRRINWRISAQHEEALFTNEFEQERIADIGIILDARLPSYPSPPPGGQKGLFEAAVHAASSLAKSFLDDGNRVSLLVYGEIIQRVFPGYGKIQFDRIQRCLTRSQPGFNYALENLHYLPTRLFSARAQLVMISPLLLEDGSFYRRLLSQGYEVILVSPNPVEEEARQERTKNEDLELAVRLARIERAVLLHSIKKVGVRVVDWPVDQPLDKVLQNSLRIFPASRRILVEGR